MTASLSDGIETVIDIFILSANAPLSEQLERQLREEGYYVTLFSEGTHLLETLRNGKPNLLMCDATVPEADAFEVCRQIKADDYLWNIPVIVITGASDLKDLLSVLDCNADNFIAYPFDPAYLLSLVEGTLTIPVERPTPDQIKTQFKIKHDEQVFVVTADRRKLLEFLLSSFEIAVNKSAELSRSTDDNRNLGTTIRNLEDTVQENSKVIAIINENLKAKEQSIADLTGRLTDREQTLREKIAAIDQLSGDLSAEKSACESARSSLRQLEQEKAEAVAAHQATIDRLQRDVADLSSDLGDLKPALEQARAGLAHESAVRKETEDLLKSATVEKEKTEKALNAMSTELEQLKINLGAEKGRVQEAEQEIKAVLEARNQSEHDLTAVINELKETAKEQAAGISRLKAELDGAYTRLRQTEENLQEITAAKESSEASLRADLETAVRAGRSELSDLQTRSDAALKAAEQELAVVSGTLAETQAALAEATRTLASRNEDLARIGGEKEKAESLAGSLNGTLRELQEQVALEQDRTRELQNQLTLAQDRTRELETQENSLIQDYENRLAALNRDHETQVTMLNRDHEARISTLKQDHEARVNELVREHDREIAVIREAHDDTRTALSSHQTSLEQMKHDLATAATARTDLEGRLLQAEEMAGDTRRDLEETVQAREQDRQRYSALAENFDRVKTSLEQETLRRQEAEDQLRDALAQQQHLEQDIERLVSETRSMRADLTTERRMLEESKKRVQSFEDQIDSLNREKREAEQAAAHLSAEIDQARVALADEWEDHMTDNERLSAPPEPRPLSPRPAPFASVRKEAEILKKRSLIVKTPTIPPDARPLPRSMVSIDPVKTTGYETQSIRSVEDLYEDDEGDRRKSPAGPVVSIIQEPASEPVQDTLPDSTGRPSGTGDSFFEENGSEESPEEDSESSDVPGSGENSSGQAITLDRDQWLDLLKWSHHCGELTQDQRMHIVRLGRLIQKGRRLTRNQEEQVAEMLALVQRLGYRVP